MCVLPILLLLSAAATPDLEVFKGTVTVTPDAANHETNIVYKADSTPSPLYFVLQHEDNVVLSPKWSGRARLFLSDGLVALVAENGKAQLFHLSDREMPASLKAKFKFDIIPAFGLARYDHRPPAH